MASAFGVQLRKTTTRVGRTGTEQLVSSEDEQTELMNLVSFQLYYEFIEDLTFKSVWFGLEDEEIDALMVEGRLALASSAYADWKTNAILVALGEKIERHIFDTLQVGAGFVRFNTLSPKDGIFSDPEKLQTLYQEFLAELLAEEAEATGEAEMDPEQLFNTKLYALYKASTKTMQIREGHEAIGLLVHSRRTLHELEKFKEGKLARPNVIVREFEEFDVQYEFRGFVFNKKFVGLSQYNPYCFFPPLLRRKDEILARINEFMEQKVMSHEHIMKLDNVIVDVVVTEDDVKVVELNPYGEFAGSCLFDWSVSEDFALLTGKAEEFEFRIQEEVPKFVRHRLERGWIRILDAE